MKKFCLFFGLMLALCFANAIDFTQPLQITSTDEPANTCHGIIADVDYDGDMDYISIFELNGPLWIEDTDGDGTPDLEHDIGSFSYWLESIEFTDMNNDGYNDIVATILVDQYMYIFTNDGSGNFTLEQPIYGGLPKADIRYIHDFNNDGIKDIYLSSQYASIYLTRSAVTDTFTFNMLNQSIYVPQPEYLINSYSHLSDMDNDGDMDIVGIYQHDSPLVWYEFDTTLNTFSTTHQITLQDHNDMYYVFDHNNDNYPDILFYDGNCENLKIIENDTTMSFSTELNIADSLYSVKSIEIADLNNDGLEDFVVRHDFCNLDVYINSSTGFSLDYELKNTGMFTFLDDRNSDGYLDIVAELEQKECVIYNNNNGIFSMDDIYVNSFYNIRNLKVANSDNYNKIVYSTYNRIGEVNIMGTTYTPLTEPSTDILITKCYDCTDIDGNGQIDFAAVEDYQVRNQTFTRLAYYQNGTLNSIVNNVLPVSTCRFADIDNDGDQDIIAVSNGTINGITVFENNSGVFFSDHNLLDEYFRSYQLIDVNNDSLLDLIYSTTEGHIRVKYNNGNMNFSLSDLVFSGATHFKLADMNNDGYLDIVKRPYTNSSDIEVYIGSANFGQFSDIPAVIGSVDYMDSYEIIDLDYDNDLDFVYSTYGYNSGKIAVLENEGVLSNWNDTTLVSSVAIEKVGYGDINSDRAIDIIYFNKKTGSIHALYNNTQLTPNTDKDAVQYNTELIGNYPNPFNPETEIRYSLENESNVKLTVYNLKGQKVVTLVNEKAMPGEHSIKWNGKDSDQNDVSSGVYFYKLNTNKGIETRKMLLLK